MLTGIFHKGTRNSVMITAIYTIVSDKRDYVNFDNGVDFRFPHERKGGTTLQGSYTQTTQHLRRFDEEKREGL